MKYVIVTIVVVLALVGALVFRSVTQSAETSQNLAPNTTIVDVRTTEEYTESHVKNALLFPVEDMQSGKLPALAKDTPIALYCRSGRRAGEALTIMYQAGFTNVISLGGLDDLKAYGLALQ